MSSVVSAEVGERFPDVSALAAALDKTGYMAGDQLAALLAALRPGMQLSVTYTRSGRTHTATVTLAAAWS